MYCELKRDGAPPAATTDSYFEVDDEKKKRGLPQEQSDMYCELVRQP
jgi:hypothetical protein